MNTILIVSNRDLIPLFLNLNFSSLLFIISLVGIIWNQRNLILMMLSIELMFFSISLNFIFFSIYGSGAVGQIYSLLIITAAATETAVGLGLIIVAYRVDNIVSYDKLISLRG